MAAHADAADARRRAQHDDADDHALDAVEPGVGDAMRLRRERREAARRIKERREPSEPQHRPAMKPLEAMLGDGFGDKAHGRQCKRGAGRSNWVVAYPRILRGVE